MACLGLEPGAAGWWAQMNPLSYGGTPSFTAVYLVHLLQYILFFYYCGFDSFTVTDFIVLPLPS